MPPTLVALPPRAGSMAFSEEDVTAVIDLLRQAQPGQAVRLTDKADDSENTARRRAELMKEQIEKVAATDAADADPPTIRAGYKIRGHVLTAGEPTVSDHTSKKGKTYKIKAYPENWGAVSLVPDKPEESNGTTPAAVTPDPDPTPPNQSPDNPVTEPEPPVQGRSTRRR